MLRIATHNERTIVDMNATVEKYSQFIPSLLALHALTGCDTVPKYYGIGKNKAFNALVKKRPVSVTRSNVPGGIPGG